MHQEYHARDLYFFFQGLMNIGAFACAAKGVYPELFSKLLLNLPALLIKEAGNTGLCERVRLYLSTLDDYPFHGTIHNPSDYKAVLPYFQAVMKFTYENAYAYSNRAYFGGISYWAASFLRAVESWRREEAMIASPLYKSLGMPAAAAAAAQKVGRLPQGIPAGGARRTRTRKHKGRRLQTRRQRRRA